MDKISVQIKTNSLEIGSDIQRARERRKLSQKELAELAGVHVTTIRRLEAKQTIPLFKTLDKILDVLNMELHVVKRETR